MSSKTLKQSKVQSRRRRLLTKSMKTSLAKNLRKRKKRSRNLHLLKKNPKQ
jgi:hypothetical protein